MTKTKLFFGAIAKRLNLILVEDKITVGTKKIVRHQISVVRRCEYLARKNKESLAHGKGQLEMVERVEFINENERRISHLVHPEIQQFEMLSASRCNDVKRDSLLVNDTEEIFVSSIGRCKLKLLPADFQEEFPEIID